LTVGRFERDNNDEARLPKSLGTATEDLRSTVEAEVAKIVERAQARASDIEEQALEKASRIEHGSEERAREMRQDSRDRVTQMLAEIDGLERVVGVAVSSLRAEAERLTGDIDKARTEPFDAPDPAPSPPPDATHAPAATDLAADAPSAANGEAPQHEGSALGPDMAGEEVREMIRQQLLSLAEGGRTRADAERMLMRFKQGGQYFDLLDEIYPEEPAGRRGLLRRRK
jgi:hypothetical protein